MNQEPDRRRHLTTLATFAAAWLVLASPAGAEDAAAYPDYPAAVQAAGAAWGEGDFETALGAMEAALAHRPGHPRARYNRALILARLGRSEDALAQLEDVASTGLSFPLPAEVFADMADDPRFQAVEDQLAANGERRGQAGVAASMQAGDFVPEGIAWHDGAFLLGSIHTGRLVRLPPDGDPETLLQPADDPSRGPWSIYGILADGDDLWIATNSDRHFTGHDGGHRSAVLRFDLDSGEVVDQFDFPGAAEGGNILGDVAMADGSLYLSDGIGGGVYRLAGDGTFHPLVAEGILRSPQGMAATADGRELFVADYSRGLFRVRLDGAGIRRLTSPDGESLFGIDGLLRDGDRLIAVQNGAAPHRVLEIGLSEDGREVTGVRVLAAALEAFDEPTLGTMADGRYCFVADSHWNRFDQDGRLEDAASLSGPTILCLEE